MGCEWKMAKKEAAEGSTTHRVKSRETKRKAEERLDRPLVSINEMNFTFNFNMSNIGMPTVEPAPALPPNTRRSKLGRKKLDVKSRGYQEKLVLYRHGSASKCHMAVQQPELGTTIRSKPRSRKPKRNRR
jgi:hypothetical protein